VAGCGRCASTYIKKVHPTFVGQSPSGVISFHNCNSIRNEIIECCCILINYYCWQASSAYLPSRARRMTSFVKISCSVGVERYTARWVLLLLELFFAFGIVFSMRRRSVRASGGRGVLVE
jgi:hypothetical protein